MKTTKASLSLRLETALHDASRRNEEVHKLTRKLEEERAADGRCIECGAKDDQECALPNKDKDCWREFHGGKRSATTERLTAVQRSIIDGTFGVRSEAAPVAEGEAQPVAIRSMTSTPPNTSKGVTDAAIEFIREMLRISWEGSDADGAFIQETADRLGLLKRVKYDPVRHAGVDCSVGEGDELYELNLPAALSPLPAPEPTAGIAELVERLNSYSRDPLGSAIERDCREAAAALAALQAERDEARTHLSEVQFVFCQTAGELKRAEAELAAMKEGAAVARAGLMAARSIVVALIGQEYNIETWGLHSRLKAIDLALAVFAASPEGDGR